MGWSWGGRAVSLVNSLLRSESLDEARPAALQMLSCALPACAVQKLMNADPVVFLLDAPSVWIDKHVPRLPQCLASMRCPANNTDTYCALATPNRYQLSRIQLPDYKETCHYTDVIEPSKKPGLDWLALQRLARKPCVELVWAVERDPPHRKR